MDDRHIPSPRPFFGPKSTIDGRVKRKRLELGTRNAGVILDITVEGIYFNGWYLGFDSREVKFSSMMEPGFISWKNLEKAKKLLEAAPPKKTRKKKEKPIEKEDEVTEEYLATLPIVTLAGYKFYIDADRRERRMVDKPNRVTKF